MVPKDSLAASRLDRLNPLSDDIALFDMYLTALDGVLAKPEIIIATKEFELSASRLRAEMMMGAGPVLRSATREFAAYEEAFARNADADGDPGLITYGWRRDVVRVMRLQRRYALGGGAVLLVAGLAGVWYWHPAAALIGAGAALLALAAVIFGCLKALTTESGRMLMERTARSGDGIELVLARNRLMTAVSRTELLAQVRTHINIARQGRFGHRYLVSTSLGLSEVYDSINRVPTETAEELEDLLARLDGASIGVAGARGSGKSMLIRQYCEENETLHEGRGRGGAEWRDGSESSLEMPGDLRCMVAAPVDYAAKDFVLHLFATFCQAVIRRYGRNSPWREGESLYSFWVVDVAWSLLLSLLWRVIFFGGAAISLFHWQVSIAHQFSIQTTWVEYAGIAVIVLGAADFLRWSVREVRRWARRGAERELVTTAKNQLARVRYLQTRTSGFSGGVNIPGGARGQLSRGSARTEQPLSYPEIVDQFRTFAHTVATRAYKYGFRVFIGVDELDKIGSAEQAERFLNEIKGIFGIPHVYFIVSVSDDALTAFERRGLPLRDAFDSSFDEIIHVGPLRYTESRRLLYRRIVGLSEPYVGLCHCLAGGLARDLVRFARNVVRTAANMIGPSETSAASGDSDDPVEYLLAREQPEPQPLTIGTIAEAVIYDELGRKARAISHAASGIGSLDMAEFQDLLYGVAYRLSPGEPIVKLIDLIAKPGSVESAAISGLRLEFAAYAYYCATLQDVFNDQLDNQRIIEATSQPAHPGSFDTLAYARNAFAINTMLAWRLITQFRAAWSMETCEPPQFAVTGQ